MLTPWSTVGTLLAHLAHAIPEREAVVWAPQQLTYAGLYAHATTAACGRWASALGSRSPCWGAIAPSG
jgi:non-ribosomal peptide synthetase component E (peptide arylation enzyme)